MLGISGALMRRLIHFDHKTLDSCFWQLIVISTRSCLLMGLDVLHASTGPYRFLHLALFYYEVRTATPRALSLRTMTQ